VFFVVGGVVVTFVRICMRFSVGFGLRHGVNSFESAGAGQREAVEKAFRSMFTQATCVNCLRKAN